MRMLICLELTVMGRAEMRSCCLSGFLHRGKEKEATLSLEPGQRLQQVLDDELGREKIFDEIEERAMAMFRNNFTGIGKKRRWNHC